jgi:iron(III) transport system substrate-binding protein
VVVYTSVDQVFAEPLLQAFERSSGIQVLAVYDVEATKTIGLVQRLVTEKNKPRADVFWNNEFSQTLFLKSQGVLAPYTSPAAGGLPPNFRDPDNTWSAFGGRARVILVNTNLVKPGQEPDSVFSLLSSQYDPQQIGLANPLFGTTLTHSAALYAALGSGPAKDLFQKAAARGVQILDGNSVVRDRVVSGQLAWGLTDTDDACGALIKGEPVKAVFPDQAANQPGTLLIPNTVGLVAGGPDPQNGKLLIDYLLSPGVEAALVKSGSIQIPSRPLPAGAQQPCFANLKVRGMSVGFEEIYRSLEPAGTDLRELFIK